MKLHEIKDNAGATKARIRVGRGIGSGKGKQSGRGQMPLHRRLPKRGFNPPSPLDLNEVNLGRVQSAIDAGQLDAGKPITVEALVEAGLVARARDGVKLLGKGELKAKVSFEIYGASKSAVAAVEKAGGSVKTLRAEAVAAG